MQDLSSPWNSPPHPLRGCHHQNENAGMTDSRSLVPPAGHSPADPTWRAPFRKHPPPGSPSGSRFTELGPHLKLGAGRRGGGDPRGAGSSHEAAAGAWDFSRARAVPLEPRWARSPCFCGRGLVDLSGGLGLSKGAAAPVAPLSSIHSPLSHLWI